MAILLKFTHTLDLRSSKGINKNKIEKMIRASKGLVKLNIIISMDNFPMKFIVKAVLDRQNDLKNKRSFQQKRNSV